VTLGVFILTHRRPDSVQTLRALANGGYTGRVHLLVDVDDPTLPEYQERYGDRVITFDKEVEALTSDTASPSKDRRSILFARNAAIRIAGELGYTHLLELDDDYNVFTYRWLDERGAMCSRIMRDLDAAFAETVRFLDRSGADIVAWAQGGDHFGPGSIAAGIKRKAMNVLFMPTTTPVRFLGLFNEDVSTYTLEGSRGHLILSLMRFQMDQETTQANPGGLTEAYLSIGTYVKSFYSVMMMPSAVKVSVLRGRAASRVHHSIAWDRCVPKILSDRWRRE
jgi:hypothetical protein